VAMRRPDKETHTYNIQANGIQNFRNQPRIQSMQPASMISKKILK
jgi:hypothetical protein